MQVSLKDPLLDPYLQAIEKYSSSISVLSHLRVDEKVFYVPDDAAFSVSSAKLCVESYWGSGLLSSSIQSLSRKLSGENCDTTVNALEDFSTKMRSTCNSIKSFIEHNHLSNSTNKQLKNAMASFHALLKQKVLKIGLKNLEKTYPPRNRQPDRMGIAVMLFKKNIMNITQQLEMIIQSLNNPRESKELKDLESRIAAWHSGEHKTRGIEEEFVHVSNDDEEN